MSRVTIELTGHRFGLLTVTERAGKLGKGAAWRCACDCGKSTVVRSDALRRGLTRSCGCIPKGIAAWRASREKSQRAGQVTKKRQSLDEAFNEIRAKRNVQAA